MFLSTDAGGVGLNLQNASAVINMDLPWNPAVLEQRIGRVHRLGQRRPVRVVHFVAQGTIEEGMLGLLAFKQSASIRGGDAEGGGTAGGIYAVVPIKRRRALLLKRAEVARVINPRTCDVSCPRR